jgi:large subunit ribosomal protein L3
MAKKLYGKKRGMTKIFDDHGNVVVCSVIEVEPNVIMKIKTIEKDGYNAVQLAANKLSDTQKKREKKPALGYYKKQQVEPRKKLFECRSEKTSDFEVGQELSLEIFQDENYVDVVGTSKGKGFQGVMKRHNFKGGPGAHGSKFHRTAGSTGMCSYPARTFKGLKMAGHMGHERVTQEGLKVVRIDLDRNLLLVKGSIPGPNGGDVCVRKALKRGNS